jgi:hypothetical protein
VRAYGRGPTSCGSAPADAAELARVSTTARTAELDQEGAVNIRAAVGIQGPPIIGRPFFVA